MPQHALVLIATACFLFDSTDLASLSPSRHTSTEVPDWKHFCTSLQSAAESPGAHCGSCSFLQPVTVTVETTRIAAAKIKLPIETSLERLGNIVITIGR